MTEQVAEQFYNLHKSIQEVISKLLKNKDQKERVLVWIRQALSLNFEKQKMYTHLPVASDGFILNMIGVMLLFCKPFTSKFSDYHNTFSKVNCLYLINDDYIVGASKVEKFDNDVVLVNAGLL
jgi:hypothetical protein